MAKGQSAMKIVVREVKLPREVRREVEDGYVLIEDAAGQVFIETPCSGSCQKPYRIDANHPEYTHVQQGLERMDRSVICCYHKPQN